MGSTGLRRAPSWLLFELRAFVARTKWKEIEFVTKGCDFRGDCASFHFRTLHGAPGRIVRYHAVFRGGTRVAMSSSRDKLSAVIGKRGAMKLELTNDEVVPVSRRYELEVEARYASRERRAS